MLRFNFATKFEEDAKTRRMLEGMGFSYDTERPDFLVYTGGEDVDPDFYLAIEERRTGWNKYADCVSSPPNRARDYDGSVSYKQAHVVSLPKLGICRGAQFLNVMCGFKLHRHILGHAIHGEHKVELQDGGTLDVTSTHHQCMSGEPWRYRAGTNTKRRVLGRAGPVDEIVLIEDDGGNCLCIQGHPEYLKPEHEFPMWTRNAILKYLNGADLYWL